MVVIERVNSALLGVLCVCMCVCACVQHPTGQLYVNKTPEN